MPAWESLRSARLPQAFYFRGVGCRKHRPFRHDGPRAGVLNRGSNVRASATAGNNRLVVSGATGKVALAYLPTGQTGTTIPLGNDPVCRRLRGPLGPTIRITSCWLRGRRTQVLDGEGGDSYSGCHRRRRARGRLRQDQRYLAAPEDQAMGVTSG